MKIIPLPAFTDNYMWLIEAPYGLAWVVDPGDPTVVMQHLALMPEVKLAGILLTHHHFDHSGGVRTLCEHFDVPVLGSHRSPITDITVKVKESDALYLPGTHIPLRVLEIPGHTLDHIAFILGDALFCGDTLFTGGCGRLFEGDASMMWHSLQKLTALPDKMNIYCGHEYTEANLRFASTLEPNNRALQQRYQSVLQRRAAGLPTVPETLGIEKATNPFLRVQQPEIKNTIEKKFNMPFQDTIDVFSKIRELKNNF